MVGVDGRRQPMTAGENMGDDVGNDAGIGDDGSNIASDNSGNDASKGDGRDAGGEGGGGVLAEDAAAPLAVAAAAVAAAATAAVVAAYCRGYFLFIVKIFLCGIFMRGGNRLGEVTPPLTLSSRLRYVGVLLGGDGNCPQKLWYVNTKNHLAKKHGNRSWQYFIPKF
jgi:hypothetical protein